MSNYTKSTNFATKDSLPAGNALKRVKGAEIDDEFNAISVAIATKANINNTALTGTPTTPTASAGTTSVQIASTAFVASAISTAVSAAIAAIPAVTNAVVNAHAYPVGSIYTAIVATNPATLLGVGTWVAFGAGRVLAGRDGGDTSMQTPEQTGGAKTHTLTINEIPSHVHGYTGTAGDGDPDGGGDRGGQMYPRASELDYEGGGAQHNIMQPYIVVYFWKRTA